jgi:FkbM family methyltransferase
MQLIIKIQYLTKSLIFRGMKTRIKRWFGNYWTWRWIDFRCRYFPAARHREKLRIEQEELQKRKAFYRSCIHAGDLCFDVGANIGNRVAPLLEIGAKVLAVEPQKSCYRYLRHRFGNNIVLETRGLGAKEGVLTFYVSDATTISSFSDEWIDKAKTGRFSGNEWHKTEQIEMTTMDVLIAKHGLPHFVKIDVEGFETEVLKGLHHAIPMISIEYTVPEQTEQLLMCLDVLHGLSSDYQFNYSSGESMSFAQEKWMSYDEAKTFFTGESFIQTGFGDVYARTQKK